MAKKDICCPDVDVTRGSAPKLFKKLLCQIKCAIEANACVIDLSLLESLLQELVDCCKNKKDFEYEVTPYLCIDGTWQKKILSWIDGAAQPEQLIDSGIPCDEPIPIEPDIITGTECRDGTKWTITYQITYPDPEDVTNIVKTEIMAMDTGEPCVPEEQKHLIKKKCKFIYTGIENTSLRYNYFYDVDLTMSDGSVKACTLPAASGWGPQMVAWTAALADCFPDACEVALRWWEWRASKLPNQGLGSIPPADFDFTAARGQYVQITTCPGDPIVVGAVVTATNHPNRLGFNLITGIGESEETVVKECKTCEELSEEDDKCNCCIEIEQDFPVTPEPLCSFQVVPGCDDLDTDDPDDDVNITAVYKDCGDGITVEFFTTDEDGNLEDYELVGGFLPACKECEIIETFTQCSANCVKVDFVKKVCSGTVITEGPFVLGTDIPSDEKGPFTDCSDKSYGDPKCWKSTDYKYTWDNGAVRNPFTGATLPRSPNAGTGDGSGYETSYDTPWGEVKGIDGSPNFAGFPDKQFKCGTATIDEILVDGVNILTTPVTVPATTGTWGVLNQTLWGAISSWYDSANGVANSFPSGIGCDRGKATNCYGQSISCYDVNLECFKATDCKGRQWEFSIVKTELGTVNYKSYEYLDCKGDLVCDWYVDKQLVVEPVLECLVEVCCSGCNPLEKYEVECCEGEDKSCYNIRIGSNGGHQAVVVNFLNGNTANVPVGGLNAWLQTQGFTANDNGQFIKCVPEEELFWLTTDTNTAPATLADFEVNGGKQFLSGGNIRGWVDSKTVTEADCNPKLGTLGCLDAQILAEQVKTNEILEELMNCLCEERCKECPKLIVGDAEFIDGDGNPTGSIASFPLTATTGNVPPSTTTISDFVLPFSIEAADCLTALDPATKISVRIYFDCHDVSDPFNSTGFQAFIGPNDASGPGMLVGESANNTTDNTSNFGTAQGGVGVNGSTDPRNKADRYLDFDIPVGDLLAGTTLTTCAFGTASAFEEYLGNVRFEILTSLSQYCDC